MARSRHYPRCAATCRADPLAIGVARSAMSGRAPDEIWAAAVEEGERRVDRSAGALVSTGLVGGVDVMLGVMAMLATTGALTATIGPDPAHFVGSVFFGVGFVFLIVGRGELFT